MAFSGIYFIPIGEYTTPVKDTETERQHRGTDGKLRGRSKRNNEPSPATDTEIEVRTLELSFPHFVFLFFKWN